MTEHAFDTITVRDYSYKVDNRTDYYLDKWLYSDHGFTIHYRTQKGMEEVYWNEILADYSFDLPSWRQKNRKAHQTSTYERSLDIHDFLTRSFYVSWVTGGHGYGLFFDYKQSSILVDDQLAYWDIL
jgi:hypothetical protein